MKQQPVKGQLYKFSQLCNLDLDDTPALNIRINGIMHPVQTSHVREDEIIKKCPEFGRSVWEYSHTTDEWIPVFIYRGNETYTIVDAEDLLPSYPDEDVKGHLWVTPKGSPRKQYADVN